MMDRLEPRPGVDARATMEDRKGNVMAFLAQKEQQVRNVIAAFNRVVGTNFESTLQVLDYAERNAGLVSRMRSDCESAWDGYLQFHRHKLLTRHRWVLLAGMLGSFLLGMFIGRL